MLEIWVKKMLFVPRMNGKATESPNLLPCFCQSFSSHVEQHLPKAHLHSLCHSIGVFTASCPATLPQSKDAPLFYAGLFGN